MWDIKLQVKNFFTKGHQRTLAAKKNILVSLVVRLLSIAIAFIMVPMTINYVNPSQYGIWLTLSSVIGWFNFFDIGLGNGLKNKLAQANALGQYELGKIFVSTTYAILTIIALVVFIVFLPLNHYLNWAVILNTTHSPGLSLNHLALLIIGFFCLQFIFQLLNIVLVANHQPSKVSLINLIGQIISIIIIFILVRQNANGSLTYLILVLAGVPILVQFLASVWFYRFSYRVFAPSLKAIQFKYAKDLLKTGGVFFIIQIGALVLFQTDNIVITQLFGPASVTVFNVAYKLFSMIIMVFTIIMTPFWSAFTDAYSKNDMEWIKSTLTKMEKYWLLLAAATLALLLASPLIFKLWMGANFQVPFSLSIAMSLYVIGYSWIMLICYFLNGINKIRLQLYLYLICTIVNIPLAIVLGKIIGIAGITVANIMIFVFMGIVLYLQKNRIINNRATGVWNE